MAINCCLIDMHGLYVDWKRSCAEDKQIIKHDFNGLENTFFITAVPFTLNNTFDSCLLVLKNDNLG